jgi:glycosyltransferase involved in cell wall biosynthesis
MSEVTVVIPTYNRRDLVVKTAGAVLAQEEVDLELVVVDDASSDGTAEALEQLDDPRLRVCRHDINRRVARARNTGIAAARGLWIAFLDDDDIWSPRKLRAQLDAGARANASMVYASAVRVDEQLRVLGFEYGPEPLGLVDELLRGNAVPGGASNLLGKAELMRALGGFDEALSLCADWDFQTRLALAGPTAACPGVLVGYVQHQRSMHTSSLAGAIQEFDYIERKFRAERAARGVKLDGIGYHRWVAGGYRQMGRPGLAIRTYLRGAVRYRNAGNVVRAAGVLLGERAMALGSRRRIARARREPRPEWLAPFQPLEAEES